MSPSIEEFRELERPRPMAPRWSGGTKTPRRRRVSVRENSQNGGQITPKQAKMVPQTGVSCVGGVDARAPARDHESEGATRRPMNPIRVLVVDDHKMFAEAIELVL